ncbi:hypothetical protein PHYPSEUDO_002210 [Phytophthora pseudosyringae]|uniref:Uncharacterized protein n=1 Tax=Phytophthora pseudosyringae TaxID=221518 RepID=A0A8T1VYZ3_9STRA|nr:hypothetical protein PHYPSEUDO_002210 [Phytophthora pseudosyringae]
MLSSKILALYALATLAAVQGGKYAKDDYTDEDASYYSDEGSSYYGDEGSSYYSDEGSSYYSDEGSSYYSDEGSSYYSDEGSSYGSGDYSALPAYTYTFDPEYSAGVSGTINVQYGGPFSTFAVISSNLDFSDVDQSEIMAFDGNCTEDVTEFKWHIHVKWPHDDDSESFEQCALALTGNHYDPLKACGPNSEFVGTDDCLLKTPEYDCNPVDYAEDPLVCEKGDLAGKFGDFRPDDKKQVSAEYYDLNYPLPEENTPEWNMMIHAVCGKATPRIACAVGKQTSGWSSLSGSYYKK